MRLREIEKELKRLKEREAELLLLLNQKKARTRVTCINAGLRKGACGKSYMIKDLVYVQYHYYHPPVSCSAGDYWTPESADFICKCGHRVRCSPELEKLQYLFKEVRNEYPQS